MYTTRRGAVKPSPREAAAALRERLADWVPDPDRVLRAWALGGPAPVPVRGFAVVEVPGSVWGPCTARRLAKLAAQDVGPVLQRSGPLLEATLFLTWLPAPGELPWRVLGTPTTVMNTSGTVDLPPPTRSASCGVTWLLPLPPDFRLTPPWLLARELTTTRRDLRTAGLL
ncbi:hypothetical protein [Kitasatospora griseola]|uniref:hypothetical protein n=1 Tax=Kitasatospora griseola TaxID=2064 RepID=UPI00342F4B2E